MKTTPENPAALISSISAALRSSGFPPFECKHHDATLDAQRNLEGRSYFCSPDNLRFHKSKVLSCRAIADGLLLRILTSDALDWNNTKRGFRVHLFDAFGTHVYGADLENAAKTRKQAERAFDDAAPFDVAAHYKNALASRAKRLAQEAADLQAAADSINL